MEELNEIVGQLEELIENRSFSGIKELLKDMEPMDISLVLQEFPKKIAILFRVLPKDLAAEVFVEMDSDYQETLLSSFTDAELKEMLDEIYIDDTVDIIEEMPANVVQRILLISDAESRKAINDILIEKYQIKYSTIVVFDGTDYVIKTSNVSTKSLGYIKKIT